MNMPGIQASDFRSPVSENMVCPQIVKGIQGGAKEIWDQSNYASNIRI